MKKLSIIMPIFNGEKYLDKSITSVLNNKYQNFELICIIDGSCDDSINIVRKYSEKDRRIVIVQQNNQGVSATRNHGINIATGDYITFLDQDDYIDENIYNEMLEKMEKEYSDISICGIEVLGNTHIIRNLDNIQEKYAFINEGILIASVWNKIFRKDLIEKFNIKFLTGTQIGEDLDFAFRYLLIAEKISYINKPYYKYILHGNNNLFDSDKRISIFYCMKNSYDFIRTHFSEQCSEYSKIMIAYNKLFCQHAIEYAFCNLPKKNRKRISNLIENICADIQLDERTRYLLIKNILKYKFPRFEKLINLLLKENKYDL